MGLKVRTSNTDPALGGGVPRRGWALGRRLGGGALLPGRRDFVQRLAPKAPQFPAKAKRVIHIFANGGPSHVDTFDPKPSLEKYAGKLLPMENLKTERKTGAAFPSPIQIQKIRPERHRGQRVFPHVAESIDDIAVIRSMHADVPNHEPSLMLMNCGEARLIRPSMGSWVTYGLGTENQNLPGLHRDVSGRLSDPGIAELAERAFCPAFIRAPTSTRSTRRSKS